MIADRENAKFKTFPGSTAGF